MECVGGLSVVSCYCLMKFIDFLKSNAAIMLTSLKMLLSEQTFENQGQISFPKNSHKDSKFKIVRNYDKKLRQLKVTVSIKFAVKLFHIQSTICTSHKLEKICRPFHALTGNPRKPESFWLQSKRKNGL